MAKDKKIDVLRHSLVPKHTILTKQQTEELLEEYQISLLDLPQMFEKDPVAISIGAKEGDVVEITRKSNTTVKEVKYYRYIKKEKV
ncbi:MAG: DNA-directed RNA polymerase subunit H [Promethearchaeia archaeon]